MRACPQAPGVSVLDHGHQVYAAFQALSDALASGKLPAGWALPDWFTPAIGQALLGRTPCAETMRQYLVYHDCGKPYCLTVDEQGRRHFEGHAQWSKRIWLQHGGGAEAGRLMGEDMDIHCLKACDLPEFAQRPTAPALLLAGIAEIHANAAMFGGQDSVSFKAKQKHWDRRGRALLKIWGLLPP